MKVRLEREGAVAVIVIDNPPVNATSHAVRAGLLAAVREADADAAIAGAVLIGARKTFVAGADIREFDRPLEDPQVPELVAALVDSAKPFIAAMHGVALGGGFELSLACDARLAAPGTRVGFPEVTLGMIPGAGGTQHVPRIVGVARAIEIIASGRRIEADEALELGLVDEIVASEGCLRSVAIGHARAMWRKRRLRDLPVPADQAQAIEAAERAALETGAGAQVALAIEAIKSAASLPYALAMAREREVFQALRNSPEAAALRAKFFAQRAASRSETRPGDRA